ncbi:hypothetical protein D0868_13305 [Hortaea werneckii]|uniref:Alternative oxidase n=1 Tax=Hortaea werneckii TaxID=91943 RepID=A0A3M6XPJ3_HORWE|nr:hypothetical protein D0868_13305 [Hortaea werneckii]
MQSRSVPKQRNDREDFIIGPGNSQSSRSLLHTTVGGKTSLDTTLESDIWRCRDGAPEDHPRAAALILMNCSRAITTNALPRQSATRFLCSIQHGRTITTASLRPTTLVQQHASTPKTRRQQFRTSKHALIKEYFPAPDAPNIKTTEAAWAHPVYTFSQMEQVRIQHRDAKDWSDWVALTFMRVLRWGLDTVSGYKHDPDQHPVPNGAATPTGSGEHSIDKADRLRVRPFTHMTERKWLMRFIFLESVAGVPGMVAGMLRHLHSMRRMKRDNGWIETLLEESYNERMHLLTFLKMAEPGWFMRMMVLGAQGVFFNSMFVSYLVSPRTCHRFVGYLEEEAVITYTRAIGDIEAGKLPMFEKMPAPDIAVQYWDMPEGRRTMKDLLLYIRADESKHREVNHTLGNLDQKNDPNPYNSKYKDEGAPHPVKDIKFQRPTGWEREEVIGEDKTH